MMKRSLCLCLMLPVLCFAGEGHFHLLKFKPDLHDNASLQRGAKYYMNYCFGCHSMQYLRYNRMAKDIGIVDENGDVAKTLLQDNLIFTESKPYDHIQNAMSPKDAAIWFGMEAPDLTLEARVRSPRWIYTYLHSFYRDNSRDLGSNNVLFPHSAMPNVLLNLQGEQIPVMGKVNWDVNGQNIEIDEITHLMLIHPGDMSPQAFDKMTADLVNFLTYASEPIKLTRLKIGGWVIAFLMLFLILAYLLKKDIWKDNSN